MLYMLYMLYIYIHSFTYMANIWSTHPQRESTSTARIARPNVPTRPCPCRAVRNMPKGLLWGLGSWVPDSRNMTGSVPFCLMYLIVWHCFPYWTVGNQSLSSIGWQNPYNTIPSRIFAHCWLGWCSGGKNCRKHVVSQDCVVEVMCSVCDSHHIIYTADLARKWAAAAVAAANPLEWQNRIPTS